MEKITLALLNLLIYILKMGNTLISFGLNIMVIGDSKFDRIERFLSWCKVSLIVTPAVYILSALGIWFTDNHIFTSFMLTFIVFNMLLGIYVHQWKIRDFEWSVLLTKTLEMCFIVIAVYGVLEMVLIVSKQNILTDIFRISLQVSTLLYPGSKILKNAFIISGGEYPPEWVMKRIYNFEKDGNLKNFINSNQNNEENNE